MATGYLSPIALILQAFTDQGVVGAGYKINTFVAGSSTPVVTYTDSTLTVQNTNPIILQSNGRFNNVSVWAPSGTVMKMVLTDPTGVVISGGTIDNLPLINDVSASLFPTTTAEQAAGVTPINFSEQGEDGAYNIKRYGAKQSNTNAQNLTALNTAITVAKNSAGASVQGGVVLTIPADCHYGYKRTDITTYPQMSGTVPITVYDYSQGATYAGYPTAYDGDQVRIFTYTPQTSPSANFHDGNGWRLNAASQPYFAINNSAGLANPSVGANDNRRAFYFIESDGATNWGMGQGTISGTGLTAQSLSNWVLQCYGPIGTLTFTAGLIIGATSGTLTSNWIGPNLSVRVVFSNGDNRFVQLTNGATTATWATALSAAATATATYGNGGSAIICDPYTLNMMFGADSNDQTVANYWFKAHTSGYNNFLIESLTTTTNLVLRDSIGSADDVAIKNVAGVLSLNVPALGDALTVSKTNRMVTTIQGYSYNKVVLTYSASIVLDASKGNYFEVSITNGTAFAMAAPTNLGDGQPVTITFFNTSGGAAGVCTFNGLYRVVGGATGLTMPPNANNISIEFITRSGNLIEVARASGNVVT